MKTRVLDCGDRQFTILEKGQGPLVLLLHGFPDIHHSWRAQINALAEAGYHCVAPLMRGYEPSSQTGPYFIAAIASDINAWLKALGQEKAHLIGHDWGAVVSYAYAALYPNRLYSLTTLAIPHMPEFSRGMKEISEQRWNSAYMAFFQLRGIAEWRIKRNNFAYLDKLWRRWSPGWNYKPSQIDKVKQQLAQPGVLTAALSYYRALNAKGREPSQ
ncbi:MAG: alpha/beta hydrolase, partial [Cellvibrionaceae bacterium]|nr:alpha/beta hydrolase [Cellvibrionaceae bacterium]